MVSRLWIDRARRSPAQTAAPQGAGLRSKLILVALALAVGIAAAAAFARPTAILYRIGQFLVVTDPLQKADILYVLNGEYMNRPGLAAQLLRQGMAPRIVIPWVDESVPWWDGVALNQSDLNVKELQVLGVPAAQIERFHFRGGIHSTWDEARALREYARLHGVRKAIVVTSEWHTRRARWILRRQLAPVGVQVMVTAPRTGDRWWMMDKGVSACRDEYLKLAYYWLRY